MGSCLVGARYVMALFLNACQRCYEKVKGHRRRQTETESAAVLYFGAPDSRLDEEDDDLNVDLDEDDKEDTN